MVKQQIFIADLFTTKFTKNFNKKHNRWAQKIYVFATFKKIMVQIVVKQQLLLQVDFQQNSTNNFNKKHKQPQKKI